jgi:urate oxidase
VIRCLAVSVVVGANQYGKSEIRMVAVTRTAAGHEFRDLNVGITLSGDLEDVHVTGDNANVVPTDTQKNTVFAFAKQAPVGEIENFALRLARHFVSEFAPIHRARVRVESSAWERISVRGVSHPHAFKAAGAELRTATAVSEADGEWVISGVEGLLVLKTAGSEFTGYLKDRYTTLQETRDRILCTSVTARWRHAAASGVDWRESFEDARSLLLERFADTHSLSLQQTLYAMASALIEERSEIVEVRMSMPNRHHFVVDLEPFGLENDNEIFRVEDRPYGLIEAAIAQADAPAAGPAWDPYPML